MQEWSAVLLDHAHSAGAVGRGEIHISRRRDRAGGEVPAGIAFHNGARGVGIGRCIGQQLGEVDVGGARGAHAGHNRGTLRAGDVSQERATEAAGGGGTRCSGGVPSEGAIEAEAGGKLAAADGTAGDFGAGDAAIWHAASNNRITDGSNALVRCEELGAVGAVIEPDAQTHIGIGEDTGGHGGHVGERGVPQLHGVESLGDGESDGGGGLAARGAAAIIAPVGGAAGGADEGELELAGAVKVQGADRDAALVVQDLGHLSTEWKGKHSDADQQECGEAAAVRSRCHSPGMVLGLCPLF